ncbi:MAG: hypothetical protein IIZ38_02650 [Sphingomonas sp.]|uniref:hypothetical protein n=1 Tax=unclassified Sphingomonas TaxID=196159 RepID=UPI00245449CE|nr:MULTISPECIES: hypothetical protein [unclassified Sphingomonas]MBQ1497191.1 hypothetical protein [Sphingomonas sp.]MDH4743089.1 hypothetical protein [Sphingomonas sp. CBMAI 2297]
MNKQHDYYQARAALQREMAAELTGSAREQHLTLAAMYEALATEPKRGSGTGLPAAKAAESEAKEDERAYLQRRAREERARAADSDDPGVRRIRFEMADEYLRRADALKPR